MSLSPLDPAIGLADRLRKDRIATVPVRPLPRLATAAATALLLVLWMLSVRAGARGAPWPSPGAPASAWLFMLALTGGVALVVMHRIWPARELRLPLAPAQEEQLARVEAQAKAMQLLVFAGSGAALVGLLAMTAAFAWAPSQRWLVAVGSLLLAGGAVAATAGWARWRPVRLLYVQTLVLHRLEAMGLGRHLAMDPRTADVLRALDGLLGELPESAVRQFLSRPEAEWYLELIAELKGGQDGR